MFVVSPDNKQNKSPPEHLEACENFGVVVILTEKCFLLDEKITTTHRPVS